MGGRAAALAGRRKRRFTRALTIFFSSTRRHTRFDCDWSSDVCSSDLMGIAAFSTLKSLGGNVPGLSETMRGLESGTMTATEAATSIKANPMWLGLAMMNYRTSEATDPIIQWGQAG